MRLTDVEKFDIKTAAEVFRQAHQLIRQGNLLLVKNEIPFSQIDDFPTQNLSNQLGKMLTRDAINYPSRTEGE